MPAPCVYQETRADLTPAFPGSTVDVLVPSNGSFFSSRQSPKRRRLDNPRISYNESTFSKQCLATESAIHFLPEPKRGKKHRNPRAILWRVLDERKVLELQAVDLYQDQNEKSEPLLTLRVNFPNGLRPSCVSLTDRAPGDESDDAVAFALTQSGELFALTLKKELFVKPGLAEERLDWIKSWKPNAFGYRTPFRLHARGTKVLWAALTDGAMVRLESEDGSGWRESFFTHGGWKSSMRGLLPWNSTASVRFEDLDLHPNTSLSLELSPDEKHLWAVGLDHTLRAWNVETGKLVFAQDLAGDTDRDLEKSTEHTIPPTRTHVLQILSPTPDDEYVIVTFSPLTREFKFWLIRDLEADSPMAWEDAHPDCSFIPPIEHLGNASVWSLESFHVEPSRNANASWTIWILARSGLNCNAYHGTFKFHDPAQAVMQSWQNDWVAVNGGLNSADSLKQNFLNPSDVEPLASQGDGSAIVERWLEFLFYPGRFTASTLETALVVYCKSPRSNSTPYKFKGAGHEPSLESRICQAVGSSLYLEPADTDWLAYERYQRSLATQWQIFYGVVKDLHNRRERVMCLSYDAEEKLPWLVLADCISPIRKCSQVELLWHNRISFANPLDILPGDVLLESLSDAGTSELGQLFFALDVFRSSFSKQFLWTFASVLKAEISDGESHDAKESLKSIFESLSLGGQVSDDDYNSLTDALEPLGGFKNLDNDLLTGVLELLDESHRGRSHKKQLNRYGARILIRGAQETLQLGSDILLSSLLLVVFLNGELEDDAVSFDSIKVFSALAEKAKEYGLLSWLTATPYCHSTLDESTDDTMTKGDTLQIELPQQTTLFEYMFIGDWSTIHHPNAPSSELLTYWCRAWTFGLRLNEKYDKISCDVFATLIKRNDSKLALKFFPFVPQTPWAEYLAGRLSLLMSEFTNAALQFKHAAGGLSSGKFLIPAELDSARLLDGVERTYLNDGLPRFYQHVVNLFEHAKAPSQAGDFAQLALEELGKETRQDPSLRTDLLSRLFSSSLQTLRFEVAFSTLMQHTDLALRKSSLKSLVQAVLKANQIQTLLNLPYPADLAVDADDQLVHLAAKNTTQETSNFLGHGLAETETLPYHKILYAFRLRRNDLRGAASCLWARLELLRREQRKGLRGEDIDEEVAQSYLALINTLSLMDHDQAWILTNPQGRGESREKRKVITLDHVRRSWQEELDRVADVAAGRFSFGLGANEMEVEA